ncbi:MAG: pilin [Candidatus Saccharimonadaceae bacterium]|nr:pilin [Candidatus Saccharimonadaceae bacterium]
MKNRFNKIITAATIGILSFSTLAFTPAFADNSSGGGGSSTLDTIDACSELKNDSVARKAAGCDGGADSNQFPKVIQGILNIIIGVSGIVAAIFVVVGGVNYMTSTGDPAKVKRAKDTILYACIGLVVCALAYAIVNWTIGTINKANTSSSNTSSSAGGGDNSGGENSNNGGSEGDDQVHPQTR